jgi:hypothetical protein
MTSATDDREHAIRTKHLAARHSGIFPALCGAIITARSLTAPPGPPCQPCTDTAAAQTSSQIPPATRGRHRSSSGKPRGRHRHPTTGRLARALRLGRLIRPNRPAS